MDLLRFSPPSRVWSTVILVTIKAASSPFTFFPPLARTFLSLLLKAVFYRMARPGKLFFLRPFLFPSSAAFPRSALYPSFYAAVRTSRSSPFKRGPHILFHEAPYDCGFVFLASAPLSACALPRRPNSGSLTANQLFLGRCCGAGQNLEPCPSPFVLLTLTMFSVHRSSR